MDTADAIKLCIDYLARLKSSDINFSEAWLFGSYAKGNQHENSDIDIAIVLDDSISHTFATEVQLMILRKGDETRIEPHPFSKDEFNTNIPIVKQIIDHGIRISKGE